MENGTRVSREVTKVNVRYQDPPQKGKVIAQTDNPAVVVVEWDKDWRGKSSVEKMSVKDLMSESEADAEMDRLSKAFNELQNKVKAQIEIAADALNQADTIASNAGEELSELHEAIGPLLRAMGKAGWRTSSLNC